MNACYCDGLAAWAARVGTHTAASAKQARGWGEQA